MNRKYLRTDSELSAYLLPGETASINIYTRTRELSEYWTKKLKFAAKREGSLYFKKTKNGPLYKWNNSNGYLFKVIIL